MRTLPTHFSFGRQTSLRKILLCSILLLPPFVFAQQNTAPSDAVTILTFESTYEPGLFRSLFVPKFVEEVRTIRRFICDDRFQRIRRTKGDLVAVDALYLKALAVANYDIARTLALSLFAVFEHRTIQLKLPLLPSFALPLTFESDSLFFLRTSHLPSLLYPTSHRIPDGDRDKLQHFFAAAYLAYGTDSQSFVEGVGNLVECFEDLLVVGGSNDWRDKAANKQGVTFARALAHDPAVLPSQYLTLPLEECK